MEVDSGIKFQKTICISKELGELCPKACISLNTSQKYAYDSKLLNMLMINLL